jgi:hypothetical protein
MAAKFLKVFAVRKAELIVKILMWGRVLEV